MSPSNLTTAVRQPQPHISVIDLKGDVTGAAENALMDAFSQASNGSVKTILLNFSGLDYMNSSGIGLLVTLLIRSQRAKQRLLACGLTQHYHEIFTLTRLNEAIGIFADEASALASA